MLTIERHTVEEPIKIGQLFEMLEFCQDAPADDASGDSYRRNEFDIAVETKGCFEQIKGLRWTKCERCVSVNDGLLRCSPEHLVYTSRSGWKHVKDTVGENVWTKDGWTLITSVTDDETQRLCDLEVGGTHTYFTNGVLSHNSHFLVFLGANALRLGLNVVHYTFELSEVQVGVRYDSNFCDIDSNLIVENKDLVLTKYQQMPNLGKLYIKQYPSNSASVNTVKAHLEKLALHSFKPHLVIIDYADIMRSSRQFDSLRHELKLLYEELRSFAIEHDVVVWSASQSNRDGLNHDIVDLSNMSEAYGKAFTADCVISLSRRQHERASGDGRLYVAKNRAGRDGIVFPIKVNTARSQFVITGEYAAPEPENAEMSLKKALKEKIKELNDVAKPRSTTSIVI